MRRLTIKGFKTAGFLLKAAAQKTLLISRSQTKHLTRRHPSKAFIHSVRSRILQITSMDSSTGSVSAGRKQMKILSRIFFTSRKS